MTINEETFEERQQYYAKLLGINNVDSNIQDRFDILDMAYKETIVEMLNEIHFMLRNLTDN